MPHSILIVEDDLTFATMLKTWLGKKGFSVDTASSNARARKQLDAQPYDLVLSDLRLPVAGISRLRCEETDERPQWKILAENDSVLSYLCSKAECQLKGRTWTAWFTAEIPISEGPWKLCGLPGLFLPVVAHIHFIEDVVFFRLCRLLCGSSGGTFCFFLRFRAFDRYAKSRHFHNRNCLLLFSLCQQYGGGSGVGNRVCCCGSGIRNGCGCRSGL